MKKSDIKQMPEYFERYINLVADTELSDAFDASLAQIESLDLGLLKRIGGKTYEREKWTVNSIIQHLTDWERILSYRALIFARRAGIVPQGIEEKTLGENSNADNRSIAEIVDELKIVRRSTKTLFDSFDERILMTDGIVYKYEMSVLAMGFNIIGHQIHHFKIIEDKYFPLANQ